METPGRASARTLTIKRRDHGTADSGVFKEPHQQGRHRVTRTVRARFLGNRADQMLSDAERTARKE